MRKTSSYNVPACTVPVEEDLPHLAHQPQRERCRKAPHPTMHPALLVASAALAWNSHPPLLRATRSSPQSRATLCRPHHQRVAPPLALAPAELWSDYLTLLDTAPLVTKACTACVIIGAGDAAAQTIERGKTGSEFDVVRVLRWAIFGLVLQGPWNHFYYLLLDGAIPPTPDPFTLTTVGKVGIDQFLQAPIFTIIILAFFAVVEGKGLGYAKDQIKNDLGGILVKNWSVFLPATVINLAFCPPELRVLFLNCVFFGWVIYLSLFLNADEAEEAA